MCLLPLDYHRVKLGGEYEYRCRYAGMGAVEPWQPSCGASGCFWVRNAGLASATAAGQGSKDQGRGMTSIATSNARPTLLAGAELLNRAMTLELESDLALTLRCPCGPPAGRALPASPLADTRQMPGARVTPRPDAWIGRVIVDPPPLSAPWALGRVSDALR